MWEWPGWHEAVGRLEVGLAGVFEGMDASVRLRRAEETNENERGGGGRPKDLGSGGRVGLSHATSLLDATTCISSAELQR